MEYPIYRWRIGIEYDYGVETFQGSKMFREKPTEEEETDFLQECINNAVMGKEYITANIKDETGDEPDRFERFAPIDLTIHITSAELEHLGDDTWCLTWFEHVTFDTGQTNEEIMSSFRDFVYRYENNIKRTQSTLMGAEERWRWKGLHYPDGKHAAAVETDPPCRCEFCKRDGIIRIGH